MFRVLSKSISNKVLNIKSKLIYTESKKIIIDLGNIKIYSSILFGTSFISLIYLRNNNYFIPENKTIIEPIIKLTSEEQREANASWYDNLTYDDECDDDIYE